MVRWPTAIMNRFLFHPATATEVWDSPPEDLAIEDVELTTGDGKRIHAWWSAPPGWRPEHGVVHYSHGNAGNLSTRGEGLRRWHDLLSQAALIYDYPGYGKSGGRPTEAGCHAAATAAYHWLINHRGLPANRIMLYGGSLGGAVAIQLAATQPCRALVLVNAFTSVRDMAQRQFRFLPTDWVVGNTFDGLAQIGAVRAPVFIAHGTADRIVPFEHGERLFAAANEPKRFYPQPNYDHHHTPGPDFYLALGRFLAICEDDRQAKGDSRNPR